MSAHVATVGANGRVTIPKAIRDQLDLRKGSRVAFEVTPEGIVIRVQRSDRCVGDVFGRLNRGVDTDQFVRDLRDE